MGIRYIGAKTQIIGEIIDQISQIVSPGAHITDLMCGTCSISTALRRLGFRVTANDVMTYSYHHARQALLFTKPPSFENAHDFMGEFCPKESGKLFPLSPYERMIEALNQVPPEEGYFRREFSLAGYPKNTEKPRNYFSPENAKKIDSIRKWVRQLYKEKQINDIEHSLLLHDLILAANDIANIAGTYGHYLAKLTGRAKDKLIIKPSPLVIIDDEGKHAVMQGYAEIISSKITCDLCYIDPPYMKRQYGANYHILETLAREDEPEAIGVSGLRPWRDQYSNFCTKTRIRDSFRKVFSTMNCPHFLISYSEDGLLSLSELEELFSEFGKVRTMFFSHKRFKSNDSQLKPYLKEYLIHLEVK
ncbi:MAG: DNA adenine methylase [Desulfobaccales bacterium]